MTDWNAEPLRFASLGRKAVVDSRGGRLTTDAGVLLLRELEQQLGLVDALDAAIPEPRVPELIVHDQRALLAQRIIALASGYEVLNDHAILRDAPALQLAAGRAPEPDTTLASPATLCRLENRVDRAGLVRIAAVLVDQFLAAHPEPPDSLILDFDATDDPVHSHQEDRFSHGKYGHHCFLPLDVFCGDGLLVASLRPANIGASRYARAVLKCLVDRLRAAWPQVKITIRADSGFCRWRLMRRRNSHGIGDVLGLARNPVLQRAAADWAERAERQVERAGQPQRTFGSFSYAVASWDCRRRVIVKAESTARGANPRFVETNVPGDPRPLYDQVYCRRDEAENRIKEQQLDLFAGRTSCHRFLANQFRLLLSSAAYVLMQALRREALADTELAEAQVGTIRLKLLKVAARVVVSTRRVVFHLAGSFPYRELFRGVQERLRVVPAVMPETG